MPKVISMQEEIQNTNFPNTRKPLTGIIIANPTSGSYKREKQQIEETVTYLQNDGWDVELKLTENQGDGRKFTKEAVKQGLDIVVAVGGDGTINEIIQELAGSQTALGVLPSGTVNVWARETGIPLENAGAREILLKGQIRSIDLGRVNDRYFLLMSTIGFDAEVTHAVEKKPIKRLGIFGYIALGTWLGIGYPNFQVVLQLGKRTRRIQVLQVVIGNTQLYAGTIKFTWQAKFDDGILDVCVVRSTTLLQRFGILFDFLLRRPQRQQWVRYETADLVKVHTKDPVAIQVDGDPAGYTRGSGEPTTFAIAHKALKVIVPQELPEQLFSQDTKHSSHATESQQRKAE
jgi:diacylglycerol kinase (ATP)